MSASRKWSVWLREKLQAGSRDRKVNKIVNKEFRKLIVVVGLFCLCIPLKADGSFIPHRPLGDDAGTLIEKLKTTIKKSEAEVSVAFVDLETSARFSIHPVEMHAASLMKVPVMIEVFKQAEQGKFNLDDKIEVTNRFKSIVDGSPYSLTAVEDSDEDIYGYIGKKMSFRELVFRMITVSSNLATNILIDRVGANNVMDTLAGWGIGGMKVLRGVEDIPAYEKGLNNRTDAASMLGVLEMIATGKAGTEQDCQEMIEILSQQKFRAKIPAGIPDRIKVANKTGSISRIDHDAAIVFPGDRKPYILVVMTRGIAEHEDAEKLIAELSRIVYASIAGE